MSVTYVSGDPLLTRAHALAFGANAKGQSETRPLEAAIYQRYPAAFATYRKQCRGERIRTGTLWFWRETLPLLAFCVVRDSSVGATRMRYVESVAMTLARDYKLFALNSLAVAPFGDREEWPNLKPILDHWLTKCNLPIVVYENYQPSVQADEGL